MENRMRVSELNQFPGEGGELLGARVARPMQPAHRVILAVSVVVPALRAAIFVATAEHRHALGKKESREEISLHAAPKRLDFGRSIQAFIAAVPGIVMIVPV